MAAPAAPVDSGMAAEGVAGRREVALRPGPGPVQAGRRKCPAPWPQPRRPARRIRPPGAEEDAGVIRDICLVGVHLELEAEDLEAAALLMRLPANADPCRAIPEALKMTCDRSNTARVMPAVGTLWQHAAGHLLERAARPPSGPDDRTINPPTRCDCTHCRAVAAFCLDPVETVKHFSGPLSMRNHVRFRIRDESLDIKVKAVDTGRSIYLVCSKTEAGFRKRHERYTGDVGPMRTLAGMAPGGGRAGISSTLARLRNATRLSQ